MPKDPRKWKGRAVVDEDAVNARQQLKEEAAHVKKLKEMSEALAKFQKQRAKEHSMKQKQKGMAKRMEQMGVFRALISGVASMQVRLTFTKWVEYIQALKEERMEAYRRQRWQLSCPHFSGGHLYHSSGFIQPYGGSNYHGIFHADHAHLHERHKGDLNAHHHIHDDDPLAEVDIKRKLKYLVEGDEQCGGDLELKKTDLPLKLPRLGGKDTIGYGKKGEDAYDDLANYLRDDSSASHTTDERLIDGQREDRQEHIQHGDIHNQGVHRQFGFDPSIMRYRDRGFHYRTGRPVYLDAKYKMFKYVYDEV